MAKIHTFKVAAPVVQLLNRNGSAFPGEGSAGSVWKVQASS